MTRRGLQLVGVALLGAAAACAHAPRTAPPPAVAWPAAPAPPAVRLEALWSAETLRPPAQGNLRRFAGLLVGEDAPAAPRDLLVRPFGVAALADGTLYVADPDAQDVLRVDVAGEVTRLRCDERGWGAPMAVAADGQGGLLVADAGRAEVLLLGAGQACRSLSPGSFGRPTGLLVLGGRVLVADAALERVLEVDLGGGPARTFGPPGGVLGGPAGGEAALRLPVALAAAPDGSVLVVDALGFRVAHLAADGGWLGSFTVPAEGGGLPRPKGVAVDAAGRVYVSDAERDQVLRFAPDGAFQVALGAGGADPGRFGAPSGLAVSGGRLYVADSQNRRIQVFAILGDRS